MGPEAARRFDAVLANPPFVPNPQDREDEVCAGRAVCARNKGEWPERSEGLR